MASRMTRIFNTRIGSVTTRNTRSRITFHVKAMATTLPKQFKKVNPVGDRVLAKVTEYDSKSSGGLVLPSSAQQKPTQGEITGVSEGCSLKAGDHILYGEYTGTDLIVEGVKHVLLKEEDVVGLMDGSDTKKLKPLGDRVLVEVSETEEATNAGLLLTSSVTEKPTFGKVISVGPGKKDNGSQTPPNVSIGSTVLYSQYSGSNINSDDEKEYIVIKESDILAELK